MNRILLLGSGGSGKSTLARRLGKQLGIRPTHLDALYWRPGWTRPNLQAWEGTIAQIVREEQWILDGYYASALEQLVPRATLIIYLDTSRVRCLLRVIRREIGAMLRVWCHLPYEDDAVPVGCPPALRWSFLCWIWRFPRQEKPRILQIIETMHQDAHLVMIRTPYDLSRIMRERLPLLMAGLSEVETRDVIERS